MVLSRNAKSQATVEAVPGLFDDAATSAQTHGCEARLLSRLKLEWLLGFQAFVGCGLILTHDCSAVR